MVMKISSRTAAAKKQKVVELKLGGELVPYPEAVAFMERRVADIRSGLAPEILWLVEHPSLYTAGTSAAEGELLDTGRLPVFTTGRGGRYTYHGPGQRVAYVMLDLMARGMDIRSFVRDLEAWLIATLAYFGIPGERRSGRVGIWVENDTGGDAKIAAIGVRIRRWVTYHGVSINVDPDLGHFEGIVPCGLAGHGVTSLKKFGIATGMAQVDAALIAAFEEIFETPVLR